MIHLCSICNKRISTNQQVVKFCRGPVASDSGLSVEIDFLSSTEDIVHSKCFDNKNNEPSTKEQVKVQQRIQMPTGRIPTISEDKSIYATIEKMIDILKTMNHKPNRSDVKDFIVAYMKEANVTDPKKINEDEMYGKYFASLIVKV